MNRHQLTTAIATRSDLPANVVDQVLTELDNELTRLVHAGDQLSWAGLFTADAVNQAERTGRHPRTGEPIAIPASRRVRLRAGSRLRRAAGGGQ